MIRRAAAATGIALLAVAAYAATLGHGFVRDDLPVIVENQAIRDLGAASNLLGLHYWQGEFASNLYRPFTVFTYALNHAAGGLDPRGYHAVNLLLHALVSLLVWGLARRVSGSEAAAAAAGAVFALHPAHSEAVAPVFGRADLLAAAGVMAALLLHARGYACGPRGTGRALAAAAFALALLSKESAIVLPLLMAALDLSRGIRPWAGRGAIRNYLAPALVAAAYLALRAAALPDEAAPVPFVDNPLAGAPVGTRLLTATAVLGRYLLLLVWPARLSTDYSYPQIEPIASPADPGFLGAAAALAALVALGFRAARRPRAGAFGPAAAFAASFILLAFAVTANVFLVIGTIMAERLLYLPSAGFCLLAGEAARALAAWPALRRRPTAAGAALALGAVLLAALGQRTFARSHDWASDETIFQSALRVSPRSFKVRMVLGDLAYERNDRALAEKRYREAIALWPGEGETRWRLGDLLRDRGELAGALAEFAEAARLEPGMPQAWFSLGTTRQLLGRPEEAIESYRSLEAIAPCHPGLHQNLGHALLGAGRAPEAVEAFRRGLGCAPGSAPLHQGLGQALDARGDAAGAEAAYRGALALDPSDAISANNLAWLLAARLAETEAAAGRAISPERAALLSEARALAARAVALQPLPSHYDTLAWVCQLAGERGAARRAIEAAIALDPGNPEWRARRSRITGGG